MSKMWSNSPRNRPENKCQECGCNCESCVDINSIHLHQEIENLKSNLSEKEHQLVTMESQILLHANQYPHGEMQALRENLYTCQDKYERLLESYRKLQKVNQGLEDKLLRIADKFENEKITLTHTVADLTGKLTEAQSSITCLQQEAEQYKNDCNLAIRMLQCKPSQFVSQKLESFPSDIQKQVNQYLNYRQPENDYNHSNGTTGPKLIRVPIPTFPPTAVVYSLNEKNGTESQTDEHPEAKSYVSAAILAKILEEREKERFDKYGKDTSQQMNGRNEYFIQMDEPVHQEVYHNGRTVPHTFNSNDFRPNNLQGTSPSMMRTSKSTQAHDTIII